MVDIHSWKSLYAKYIGARLLLHLKNINSKFDG